MGELIGFVTIPRTAGSIRHAGAFFSAAVEAKIGPDTWKVHLDGRSLVVTTSLALTPGQSLKLKLVSQEDSRWVFQTVAGPKEKTAPLPPLESALMAAFVSRGLPIAAEKIASWTKWLGRISAPVDKEGWAASLEARGLGPGSQMALDLQPWLAWQESLENGTRQPPPEDPSYWDLWNTRRAASGEPWLVTPIRWAYNEEQDAGLLQAHWNPQAQGIDRWNLTAAPAGIPFRLAALTRPGYLDLVWHFFRPHDRAYWQARVPHLAAGLSSQELSVSLRVAGHPETPLFSQDSVNVEA